MIARYLQRGMAYKLGDTKVGRGFTVVQYGKLDFRLPAVITYYWSPSGIHMINAYASLRGCRKYHS